jgi:hypothetical protein
LATRHIPPCRFWRLSDRDIARERAEWLFNYDPLTVPLQ